MSDQGTEQWERDASGGSGVYLVKRGSPVSYGPFALQSAAENLRKDLNALEAELRDTRQRLETAEERLREVESVDIERLPLNPDQAVLLLMAALGKTRNIARAALSRDPSSEEGA